MVTIEKPPFSDINKPAQVSKYLYYVCYLLLALAFVFR